MADRPIIFSAPMIRALLDGRKTQTRRILKTRTDWCASEHLEDLELRGFEAEEQPDGQYLIYRLPYAVGGRLWVRENCQAQEQSSGEDGVFFPADEAWEPIQPTRESSDHWLDLYHYSRRRGAQVPSIHMPRWASRLTLLVTEVRVQRLQDISHKDARAEGLIAERTPAGGVLTNISTGESAPLTRTRWQGAAELPQRGMERAAFRDLWESIHGPEAWGLNPWVVAVSFTVHRANIDLMAADALAIAGAA